MTIPNSADLRRKLNIAFDDVTLDAFCFDYFRALYDRFGRGMRNAPREKIGLLLDYCHRQPNGFELLLQSLRKEYTSGKRSGTQGEELKPVIDALTHIRPWMIVHPYPALPNFTGRKREALPPAMEHLIIRTRWHIRRRGACWAVPTRNSD